MLHQFWKVPVAILRSDVGHTSSPKMYRILRRGSWRRRRTCMHRQPWIVVYREAGVFTTSENWVIYGLYFSHRCFVYNPTTPRVLFLQKALRYTFKMPVDLLHPSPEQEARTHKLKRLVQSPDSFFMDIKCPGCFQITTVFSHAQTVVLCGNCNIMLCQPTGGKARLTEGCSYRKKVD